MNREDCLSSFSLSLGLLQLPRVRPHCCHVQMHLPVAAGPPGIEKKGNYQCRSAVTLANESLSCETGLSSESLPS